LYSFFTAICPVGVALEARHAGGTDATLFHGAKTHCHSLGNWESIIKFSSIAEYIP
jgi:hypothetical protein